MSPPWDPLGEDGDEDSLDMVSASWCRPTECLTVDRSKGRRM